MQGACQQVCGAGPRDELGRGARGGRGPGCARGYYGGPAGQFQRGVHRGRHVPGHEPGGVSGRLRAAFEEAEHAAKFAELLGEVVTDSTKKNLEMRVEAENGATAGKVDLATRAKKLNLDAIHDTVHEMARDEARHGKAFEGLLKRYFGK